MRYFLLIGLLILGLPAAGQGLIVRDRDTEPLPGARVTFWDLKGGPARAVLSDGEGKAPAPAGMSGALAVEVALWGYRTLRDTLEAGEMRTIRLEAEPFPLDQVVITAQYARGPAEQSLFKVKVIDRKKIDAMGAVNLRDALRNEVNTRISQDNILGSSVGLQGLSGQNVKILVDGVPVIGRLDGNIDLSQLNLNEVERIEVVEGPMSVNFGTDALAGVINLVTRKGKKEGVEAGLNSYYETAGQYNLDGRLGYGKGRHRVSLSGGRNYFDGWSARDPFISFPSVQPADTNRFKSWKPKEQYFGRLQYQADLKALTIRPYLDYFYENVLNRGFPRGPYFETAFDETYRTWRSTAGLQLHREMAGAHNFRVVAAFNDYRRIKNTWFRDLTTLEQELSAAPSDQDSSRYGQWMSRGSYSSSRDSTRINFELGYELSHETAAGLRIEGLRQTQSELALFGSAEFRPWKDMQIRPGLRYSYNSAYRAPLVPSVNLRQRIRMREKFRESLDIRLSYARGFRAPSLKELYFEFVDINHNIVGNDALLAEYSHNFQGGLEWRHAGRASRIKAEAGAYYNDIRNLITLVQIGSGTEYSYGNIGQFRSLGFQGNVEWARERISLSLGGAMVGRSNAIAEAAEIPGFSFSPELRANVRYEFARPGIGLAAFYKYTGVLPGFALDEQGGILETRIADYHLLDLTASRDFWDRRICLSIGGKNLLNVRNITTSSVAGGVHSTGSGAVPVSWGRSIFIGLKLNLNPQP